MALPPHLRKNQASSVLSVAQAQALMASPQSGLRVTSGNSFALLSPAPTPARTHLFRSLNDRSFLECCTSDEVTAIDFETEGNDPTVPGSRVVGVGLSNSHGSVYFTAEHYAWVMQTLSANSTPLIAHNLFFDASWPTRDFPDLVLQWTGCTYAIYKLLATEGWPNQSWSLKSAQKDLLLWPETNERELDAWLVENGHYTSTSTVAKQGYVPGPEGKWYAPDKGRMHLAPASILGHYCMLDAESTWLLYTNHLCPTALKYHALAEYLSTDRYTRYILLHVKQKLRGIQIDREALTSYQQILNQRISQEQSAFFAHPAIQEALRVFNEAKVAEVKAKEPARFKKNGQVSKMWENWNTKYEEAKATNYFNMNSGDQKRWLFYEQLGFPVIKETDKGNPATDGDALLGFGDIGAILIRQNEWTKELTYVDQVLGMLDKDAVLHGGARVPGTLTGRIAANNPNYSQFPKSKGMLSTFVARPGYKLVQLDFSAIEQVVLAELSKDKALWKLYGPNAKKNDVYLFNGASMPVIGPVIRASGYDPENPTPESIAKAKKECKHERGIAKIISLAAAYGASATKIATILRLQGISVSDRDAEEMHRGYWELYAGVRTYRRELEREFRNRGGWFLNGIGRPLGVFHDLERDILNRMCQSTGHDCLVLFVGIVADVLDSAGIEWHPWIVDFHDELILEIKEEQAEEAAKLVEGAALRELNVLLNGQIPIKGNAIVTDNLAAIKCED